MAEKTLLKNGVVIVHDADDHARGVKADLLIEGSRIARIESNIHPGPGTSVVDCTDLIIAPGFIDTHRHMYNTALRGRHGNNTLPDYLVQGILQGGTFNAREIFWGQLAGCLESINNGTTTVVDHSHVNYAEELPEVAIRATVLSGIRSIYGYCITGRVASWSPFALNPNFIGPFAVSGLKKLAAAAPFGDGRVKLGVAFDGWFLPQAVIKAFFKEVKDAGVSHVTTHNAPSAPGVPTSVETMHACEVLSPAMNVILAHANLLSPTDVALVKQNGAYLSSTPSVELQMGMGAPACFDPNRDVQSHSSLGIDCHNVVLASIVNEMRCALVHSRATYHDQYLSAGKVAALLNHTVQEVYALGTVQGARAVDMEKEIGSLEVGKKADVIVFDALGPSMICGAQYDPVTAIVMHSTPGDIVMTFVDGRLRKADGKILPVQIDSTDAKVAGTSGETTTVSWSDVSRNLLHTQMSLNAKIERLDLEAAKNDACTSFGMDTSNIVAKL